MRDVKISVELGFQLQSKYTRKYVTDARTEILQLFLNYSNLKKSIVHVIVLKGSVISALRLG